MILGVTTLWGIPLFVGWAARTIRQTWWTRQADLAQYVLYEAALKSHGESVSEAQRRDREAITAYEWELRQRDLSQLSWWLSLDGPRFEEAIAQLLRILGYDVQRTGGSGDKGVDLRLERPDIGKAIVQCKAHKVPIGPGVVRDLYGTLIDSGVAEGWLIATSEFTAGAQNFASGKPIRLLHIREFLPLEKSAGQTDQADDYEAEERLAIQQEAEMTAPPPDEIKFWPYGRAR